MNRRFLFLQGPCSPFFSQLGRGLADAGYHIAKLNYNCGDAGQWRQGCSQSYRGKAEDLCIFYRLLFEREGYTDIILFGDHRPVHLPAIQVAKTCGINVHVFEEGYFRPYWITLERNGVNAKSELPNDPAWYRKIGPRIPDYGNGQEFKSSFSTRAYHDIVYQAAGIANRLLYPEYRTHAPVSASAEYRAYAKRAVSIFRRKATDAAAIQNLIYSRTPFWLLPLQLNSDAQIRCHSPYADMPHMLQEVIASFARMCHPSASLAIKNHPLDPGLMNYEKIIDELCARFAVCRKRVIYLESGPLPALLNHARGVITVNSTVGGSALVHSRPLMALGQAIYHMPGLTFQGHLDDFWRHGRQPDPRLFRWFRNTVIHSTQINGGFYAKSSIAMSVSAALPRLLATCSRLNMLR
ncbi:capsule biosynthesis protein [Bordetella petrii]|uniref:capsule biosynthesis protein n=1 Tax=Bordetella petrii TaxID=94624 RepID=UPI001E5CCF83|nr:capsular biosynthesis protein [Bordetella petrii]MCD0501731.1 capsular biosynthesis protein [Bordetella petrii]